MSQQAKVGALDALDAFRASLLVYLSQARTTLEEVSADVLRLRLWLENEQRTYWENQVRLRTTRYPTIYTSTRWWSMCMGNNATFGADPLWIARYNTL